MTPTMDLATLAFWLDMIGTFAFGLSGGVLAVRKQLDLFGVIVLATAAATAGGAIRDAMIGAQPAAVLVDMRYLSAAIAAGITAFLAYGLVERLNKPVMLLDAVGLGVFVITGTQKALSFGLHPVAACVIGMVSAIGGGIIRDILVAEVPRVLREEIYAVAAILGAMIVVGGTWLGVPPLWTAVLSFTATFATRVISVRMGLAIPKARR